MHALTKPAHLLHSSPNRLSDDLPPFVLCLLRELVAKRCQRRHIVRTVFARRNVEDVRRACFRGFRSSSRRYFGPQRLRIYPDASVPGRGPGVYGKDVNGGAGRGDAE